MFNVCQTFVALSSTSSPVSSAHQRWVIFSGLLIKISTYGVKLENVWIISQFISDFGNFGNVYNKSHYRKLATFYRFFCVIICTYIDRLHCDHVLWLIAICKYFIQGQLARRMIAANSVPLGILINDIFYLWSVTLIIHIIEYDPWPIHADATYRIENIDLWPQLHVSSVNYICIESDGAFFGTKERTVCFVLYHITPVAPLQTEINLNPKMDK